jgi:hypothetical protein
MWTEKFELYSVRCNTVYQAHVYNSGTYDTDTKSRAVSVAQWPASSKSAEKFWYSSSYLSSRFVGSIGTHLPASLRVCGAAYTSLCLKRWQAMLMLHGVLVG